MKVLLRDQQSGMYHLGNQRLVAEPTQALDFVSPANALKYIRTNGLKGVEVVVRRDDAVGETVLDWLSFEV